MLDILNKLHGRMKDFSHQESIKYLLILDNKFEDNVTIMGEDEFYNMDIIGEYNPFSGIIRMEFFNFKHRTVVDRIILAYNIFRDIMYCKVIDDSSYFIQFEMNKGEFNIMDVKLDKDHTIEVDYGDEFANEICLKKLNKQYKEEISLLEFAILQIQDFNADRLAHDDTTLLNIKELHRLYDDIIKRGTGDKRRYYPLLKYEIDDGVIDIKDIVTFPGKDIRLSFTISKYRIHFNHYNDEIVMDIRDMTSNIIKDKIYINSNKANKPHNHYIDNKLKLINFIMKNVNYILKNLGRMGNTNDIYQRYHLSLDLNEIRNIIGDTIEKYVNIGLRDYIYHEDIKETFTISEYNKKYNDHIHINNLIINVDPFVYRAPYVNMEFTKDDLLINIAFRIYKERTGNGMKRVKLENFKIYNNHTKDTLAFLDSEDMIFIKDRKNTTSIISDIFDYIPEIVLEYLSSENDLMRHLMGYDIMKRDILK